MALPVLELKSVEQTAATYYFRTAPSDIGWALCTVNDRTGELLIVSDWGNWAHLWNPRHLGSASLTHFIGERDSVDYIVQKLLGRRGSEAFCPDETTKHLRRQLVKRRLEDGRLLADSGGELKRRTMGGRGHWFLKAYEARELWGDLGSLAADIGPSTDENSDALQSLYLERLYHLNHYQVLGDDLYEDAQHVETGVSKILRGTILPALRDACLARTKIDPILCARGAEFAAKRAAERAAPIVGDKAERVIDDPDQIIATASPTLLDSRCPRGCFCVHDPRCPGAANPVEQPAGVS